MPDYSKGKIYKLWCIDNELIYIGSTTQPLHVRFGGHKRKENTCVSKLLFEASNNVKIELIEKYPCNDRMELNKREGEIIRLNNCVNKYIAGRTKKEYHQDYQEEINQRHKKHYQQNKEQYQLKHKIYHKANKAEIKIKSQQWYQDNKEEQKLKHKIYYEKNHEEQKLKQKQYYEANKDIINQKARERYKLKKLNKLNEMK